MPTLLLSIKHREIGRFRVGGARIRIGRAPDCDVVLDNVAISRRHASIELRDGGYWVVDEGSQNGVFLNGAKVQASPFRSSDELLVGKFTLTMTPEDDEAAPMSMPARPGTRNPQRTLALAPADVQKLIAASETIERDTRDTKPPELGYWRWAPFAALAVAVIVVCWALTSLFMSS
jgi:pSer/pThr/pTyr-binding forkhead associated (FHA) protein